MTRPRGYVIIRKAIPRVFARKWSYIKRSKKWSKVDQVFLSFLNRPTIK